MDYKKFTLPLLILLLSLALRIFFLSQGPFHSDALELAIKSRATVSTLELHHQHGAGYPLNVILGTLSLFVFTPLGLSDVQAVNLMSAVFGSFAVLMLFFVTKELFGERTALISSVLFSLFPSFLIVSTFAMNHTPAIFFALCAIYFMLKFCKTNFSRYVVFSGSFIGLTAATRLPDILIIFPVVYLYLTSLRKTQNSLIKAIFDIKLHLKFILSLVLPLTLIYLPMLLGSGITAFVATHKNIYMGQFLIFDLRGMNHALNYAIEMLTATTLVIPTLGLIMVYRKNPNLFIFLIIWLVSLFLFYANISTLNGRFLIIALIPLIISSGFCLDNVTKYKNTWLKILGYVIFILIILLMCLPTLPVLNFRKNYSLAPDFARKVGKIVGKKAKIIAVDEALFLEYYGHLDVVRRPITCNESKINNYLRSAVDENVRHGYRIYIIDSGIYVYDPCGKFKDMLFKNYQLKLINSFCNEDWHGRIYNLNIFRERLFEITLPK
jgi:4-amino-4-deoxy-L-arabinose transferase-like glycosyltransferase